MKPNCINSLFLHLLFTISLSLSKKCSLLPDKFSLLPTGFLIWNPLCVFTFSLFTVEFSLVNGKITHVPCFIAFHLLRNPPHRCIMAQLILQEFHAESADLLYSFLRTHFNLKKFTVKRGKAFGNRINLQILVEKY